MFPATMANPPVAPGVEPLPAPLADPALADPALVDSSLPAPAMFVSHGTPMFALEPGWLGPRLDALGARLPGLTAVLVVSAFWQSPGVRVMTTPRPTALHDFSGFPAALRLMRYAPPGAPGVAALAGRLLAAAGFGVTEDDRRGLDHGAWIPLSYLFPDADVPTCQVSLPLGLDPAGALRLGTALAPLRDQGVLVVGSGSLTFDPSVGFTGPGQDAHDAEADDTPDDFADWVHDRILAGDAATLVSYRTRAPHARQHPAESQFLPLLVALGAARQDTPRSLSMSGGPATGGLSMDSFVWGATGEARAARMRPATG